MRDYNRVEFLIPIPVHSQQRRLKLCPSSTSSSQLISSSPIAQTYNRSLTLKTAPLCSVATKYANDSHIVQPCDVMAKLQVSADLFEEKEEKSDEKSEETDEKSGLKKCLRLLRSH
uniref:Uncharacterized protein n=1 Tax=Brassica campestris TaxID=3711 RepID=M4CEN2_BRACM